jgi:hypothetical protein
MTFHPSVCVQCLLYKYSHKFCNAYTTFKQIKYTKNYCIEIGDELHP